MEHSQLEIFLELTRTKSFSKTAENLYYTQPNISSQIKKLEDELGCALFNRLGKVATLTKKGEEFYPFAKQIIQLSKNAIQNIKNNSEGSISILSSESICLSHLPSIITEFRKTFPDANITISLHDINVVKALQNSEADLALILDDIICCSNVTILDSREQKVSFFASPEFIKKTKLPSILRPGLFEFLPVIITKSTCSFRKHFAEILKANGITPNIVLETGSIQIIKEMAMCSMGIALLPENVVKKEIENGKLVHLEADFQIKLYKQLLCHKDKIITPFLQSFINKIKEEMDLS